jgi:hypothetical protein
MIRTVSLDAKVNDTIFVYVNTHIINIKHHCM